MGGLWGVGGVFATQWVVGAGCELCTLRVCVLTCSTGCRMGLLGVLLLSSVSPSNGCVLATPPAVDVTTKCRNGVHGLRGVINGW